MLRPILMRLCLFRNERERAYSEAVALRLLDTMVFANAEWLKLHPEVPALYKSGVRYVPEPDAQRFEDWPGVHEIYSRGYGDCEDLAAWRAAELQVNHRGEGADMGSPSHVGCAIKRRQRGRRNSYHVVVALKYPDGRTRIEDPSSRLGMYKVDQALSATIREAFESPGSDAGDAEET